jgi:hypothetical protein
MIDRFWYVNASWMATTPPQFREWIRGHQESRRERNRKLIAKLNSLGVEITMEEVQALGKHLTGGRISPKCCCARVT